MFTQQLGSYLAQLVPFYVCSKPTSGWNKVNNFIDYCNLIYLRQMQGVFLGFVHGWLYFAVHSRGHLTMQQFSFDLRLTTVEQCPCLALSAWKTEAKTKISKAKSPPTQCTHHAHNLSSSHQCTLFASSTTQHRSLFKHHIASPSCESTASVSEGWNDQSEIIPDWVNTSKTTVFYTKMMDFPLKNTSWATSLSFLQWLRDSVAFC